MVIGSEVKMQERLLKYLRAIRAKQLEYRYNFAKPPSNKMAKLKGAEEMILTILENGRIENLWENLKL